jgi:hypothetical protein
MRRFLRPLRCKACRSADEPAVRDFVRHGDESGQKAYSCVCLERVWSCQEFSQRMLQTAHDAGDAAGGGAFRHGLARAGLHRLIGSARVAREFAELMAAVA